MLPAAGGTGWILSQGNKILNGLWCKPKKKKNYYRYTCPFRGIYNIIHLSKIYLSMILFSLHTLVTKEVFPENLVTSHKSLGFQSRIQNMLWAAEDGAPEQSFSFSFLGGHSYAIKVRRGTKLDGDGDLNCLIWTRKKEWTGKNWGAGEQRV